MSFTSIARAILGFPRVLLAGFSLAFSVIAILTLSYTPNYLHYGKLWAIFCAITAGTSMVAVWWPSRATVSATGALAVTLATARGVTLIVELLQDDPPNDLTIAAGVSSTGWFLIAWLTYFSWVHAVQPWAIKYRGEA